jgi:hypothetical protein
MKVALIGVGNMGKPMAANIAEAGHELSVFDANVGLAAQVAGESGATALQQISAIGSAEIIVTMLPDARAVREVATAPIRRKGAGCQGNVDHHDRQRPAEAHRHCQYFHRTVVRGRHHPAELATRLSCDTPFIQLTDKRWVAARDALGADADHSRAILTWEHSK